MKNSVCLLLFTIAVIAIEDLCAQVPCTNIAAWSNAQPYSTTGTQVVYNNNLYQSKWWANPSDVPGNANGPWQFMGNCQSGTSAPLPTSFSVSGWASSGTAIYTLNSGNVGIGNPNPGQKLDVYGNIQLTGAGNKLMFPDGTSLSSAPTNVWQLNGDTAYYPSSAKILGKLKIGNNSLYLSSQANTGTITNEIYTDNGPLILNNTNAQKVLIGTTDASNLAGLNSYSQTSKVVSNGHISLLGWDNTANTTVDNWFRTDKMVMQNIQDQDANHWNRGLISNNLIWDSGINNYSVLNNTNGQNDFAAIRFDNFGSIGIYTAPQNGNYANLSVSSLESYNRFYISNNGNIGIGGTGSLTEKLNITNGNISFKTANTGIKFQDGSFLTSANSANIWGLNGTNIFTNTLSNNVGIGIASPTAKLEINGDARISSEYQKLKIGSDQYGYVTGDDGVGKSIFVYHPSRIRLSNSPFGFGSNVKGVNISNDNLLQLGNLAQGGTHIDLKTSANTSGYGVLEVIKEQGSSFGDLLLNPSGGNIGIGLPTPSAKLHVKGEIRTSNSTGLTEVHLGQDNYAAISYLNGPNTWWHTSNQGGYLTFGTGGSPSTSTTKLLIDDSGRLGVGISSPPSVQLDVKGEIRTFNSSLPTEVHLGMDNYSAISFLNDGYTWWHIADQGGNLTFGTGGRPSSSTTVFAMDNAGNVTTHGNIVSSGVDFVLGLNDGRVNSSGNNPASLRALSHTNWRTTEKNELIINVDGDYAGGTIVDGKGLFVSGNLGIGSYSPSEKLVVSGNVKVTGKIATTEVCVNTGATWCDYVFDKSYNLPSLKEVASFIEKNKHLPGIPPAKEIEKDGISVSKMLTMQMEKIEQLTLYILEQEKKIQELQKAVLKK